MDHSRGNVDRDSVTVIGKRGPRGGTTLKTQSDILAAQKKGYEVVTDKKCKKTLGKFSRLSNHI
jgi:hypothetical protein